MDSESFCLKAYTIQQTYHKGRPPRWIHGSIWLFPSLPCFAYVIMHGLA